MILIIKKQNYKCFSECDGCFQFPIYYWYWLHCSAC